MLELCLGKKLRPKEHIRDFEESVAEVTQFNGFKIKYLYYIVIDDNFGAWYSQDEADKDFENLSRRSR